MTESYRYIDNFMSREIADGLFLHLRNDLDWVRHDNVPRSEYYCNDTDAPYTYGVDKFARTYYPQPWTTGIMWIRKYLEEIVECDMDVCFLNYYKGGSDKLGWHADDSPEMDDARPVVSVSLGSPHEIKVRANEPNSPTTSYNLGHGSVFIMMPGVQDTHKHMIPGSGKDKFERISLTFRGYVK